MNIDTAKLRARWGWTTLVTFIVMAVVLGLDAQIKAASGYGILDLEMVKTAEQVSVITAAWARAEMLPQIGFFMGFDYLYMPAYGFSVFYGALAAREAFAAGPGTLRRLLTVLAFAPLAGASFDVVENALEAQMLFHGATDQLACLAYSATVAKFALIAVGLALTLTGLAGLLTGRLKRP